MQNVVSDEPYEFVPPYRGKFWSWLIGRFLPYLLRSRYGIVSWKIHGIEQLRQCLTNNDGIIVCPNHSSISDPMMCGVMTLEGPCHIHAMASWHVFRQKWLETWVSQKAGGFSVYREGMDRKALDAAVEIVSGAERPLVIFPEGVISAANDRLLSLMDGTGFIARRAAKKRAKSHPDSRVVLLPVAYRYEHEEPADKNLPSVLDRLEKQFFWQTPSSADLVSRVNRLREAIQSAREVQFDGHPSTGDVEERMAALVERILHTHESEWLGGPRSGDVITRVKDLRTEILSDMTSGEVTDPEERSRRWRHLTDVYYCQCMSLHAPGYIDPELAGDRLNHRLYETVARIEEELTDTHTTFQDLHVDVHFGEPIEVDPQAGRSRGDDPLMAELRSRMLSLLQIEDCWVPQPVQSMAAQS